MATGLLGQIANPQQGQVFERMSDLKSARQSRQATEAATQAQQLETERARIDEIGRASQALLSSFYEEGQQQPSNPTEAARSYFQTRKRLVDMGVPEDALPSKVPTRSDLEQARDQAMTVKEQIDLQQGPEPEQFTLNPGDVRYQSGPDGVQAIATGLPEDRGNDVKASDTYLNKETGEEVTLVRTGQGLGKQVVDPETNQPTIQPVNSENYTKIDRRRVETSQIGGEGRAGGDLTVGDVVSGEPGDFPMPDPQLAAGPRDRLVSIATRIPVVNEAMQAVVGQGDAGIEERTAARLGDEVENLTIMAFKPSDDERVSNLQIELARKLAPRMGAFSTDESVMTDLRVLHERTKSKLDNKLRVANNEKFDESTRLDAEQRALQLGNLISLTGPLLQAAEDPKFAVESMLGSTIDNADPQQVRATLGRMPSGQRRRVLNSLTEEQATRLDEAWSQQ